MIRRAQRAWLVMGVAALGGVHAAWGQPGALPAAAQPGPATIFDEKADAAAEVQKAREAAKTSGRHVLVLWGRNNDRFCASLYRLLQTDPAMQGLVSDGYVLVTADIGPRFEQNIELAENYQADVLKNGVPQLTVIDPAAGSVLAGMLGKDAILKPAPAPDRLFDTGFVQKFLEANVAPAPTAQSVLSDAQQAAKHDGKRVLLWVTEPGCGSCPALAAGLGGKEACALLGKAYTVRRIDTARNAGSGDLLKRLGSGESKTAPWLIVLDADGAPVPEGGKGLTFDPANGALAPWLVQASGGKLTKDDGAALATLLAATDKPRADAKGAETRK